MSRFIDEPIYDPPDPNRYYFCYDDNHGALSRGFTLLMKWVIIVRYHPELYEKIKKIDKEEINKQNEKGCTALYLACLNAHHGGSYEAVELLLKMGADPNIQNFIGRNPLMCVCGRAKNSEEIKIIKNLIKHNSNINFVDNERSGPLSLLLCNFSADNVNPSEIFELFELIGINENKILNINKLCMDPLAYACCHSPYFIFEKLLSFLSEEKKRELKNRGRYLHLACGNPYPDGYKIVDDLLNLGFDINVVDIFGKTPYYYANVFAFKDRMSTGWKDVINRLCPKNFVMDYEESLFAYVRFRIGHRVSIEQIDELINKGANLNAANEKGETVLKVITRCRWELVGDKEVLEYLVKDGVDIDHRDTFGSTALITATLNGHYNYVLFLLNENADVNMKHGKNYKSPLRYAIEKDQYEIARLLLEYGADPFVIGEYELRRKPEMESLIESFKRSQSKKMMKGGKN